MSRIAPIRARASAASESAKSFTLSTSQLLAFHCLPNRVCRGQSGPENEVFSCLSRVASVARNKVLRAQQSVQYGMI
jgi:hypothetical protein